MILLRYIIWVSPSANMECFKDMQADSDGNYFFPSADYMYSGLYMISSANSNDAQFIKEEHIVKRKIII